MFQQGNQELMDRALRNHGTELERFAGALPRIAMDTPDEAGTLLALLIGLAYANVDKGKRAIWLSVMRGFLDGLPAAVAIDEMVNDAMRRGSRS